jgi:hypothetical protein
MSGVPKSRTAGIKGEYDLDPDGRGGSCTEPRCEGVAAPGRMYRTELTDPFLPSLPLILAAPCLVAGMGPRKEGGAEKDSGVMCEDGCNKLSKER